MGVASLLFVMMASSAQEVRMPLMVEVTPSRPIVPLRARGKASLVYELQFTNYEHAPVVLKSITASSANKTLLVLRDDNLKSCLRVLGGDDGDATAIGPGKSVVAFLWIDVPVNAIPKSFSHRFTFEKIGERPDWLNGVECRPDSRPLRHFGPPLKGSNWVAGNGPANTTGHRRARFAIGCEPWIGQRFAIDYVQIDKSGKTYEGDESKNESYYCYGESALAVTDATVVSVVDGIPPNVPQKGIGVPITMRSLPGNHIILDVGGGLYAAYAHLIPGSIVVRRGQKVRKGQVLARVGNTGNSSEPHLHFQIMNKPSFIEAQGIPYVQTDAWVQDAKADDTDLIFKAVGAPRRLSGEMPVVDQIVEFRSR